MDIIQATAIATRVMQFAASEPIPPTMPDYVTVSTTGIGFQMRTFAQVKEWAVYLEVEFDYEEVVTQSYRQNQELANVGFGNARRVVDDPDFGEYRIHVHHNEIMPEPKGDPLFPDPDEPTE